jgi:hypothetical protein
MIALLQLFSPESLCLWGKHANKDFKDYDISLILKWKALGNIL